MDYQKNYYDYMSYVKTLGRKKTKRYRSDGSKNSAFIYYEKHHIKPRACGGTDDHDNLVLLTAREHFLAHYLLCKIYSEGPEHYKMLCAFMYCKHGTSKQQKEVSSSRFFEKLKQERAELLGDQTRERIQRNGHHLKGTKASQEHREKLSASQKKRWTDSARMDKSEGSKGAKNPAYGKHWFTNKKTGKIIFTQSSPGEDWVKQGLTGKHWYHNLETGQVIQAFSQPDGSAWLKGMPPETIEKIRQKQVGHPSYSNKDLWRRVLCETTGEVFPSIAEAAKQTGIEYSRLAHHLRGDTRSVRGPNGTLLIWKYDFGG